MPLFFDSYSLLSHFPLNDVSGWAKNFASQME